MAEAEYRSMSTASSEVIWLQHLLQEFGVFMTSPTPLYANNMGAIRLAKNGVFHELAKYIEVDC